MTVDEMSLEDSIKLYKEWVKIDVNKVADKILIDLYKAPILGGVNLSDYTDNIYVSFCLLKLLSTDDDLLTFCDNGVILLTAKGRKAIAEYGSYTKYMKKIKPLDGIKRIMLWLSLFIAITVVVTNSSRIYHKLSQYSSRLFGK